MLQSKYFTVNDCSLLTFFFVCKITNFTFFAFFNQLWILKVFKAIFNISIDANTFDICITFIAINTCCPVSNVAIRNQINTGKRVTQGLSVSAFTTFVCSISNRIQAKIHIFEAMSQICEVSILEILMIYTDLDLNRWVQKRLELGLAFRTPRCTITIDIENHC